MYKDKEKERDNRRDNMRSYRQRKSYPQDVTSGSTRSDEPKPEVSSTSSGGTKAITYKGLTVPGFARGLPELTIKNVLDVLYHRARLGLFDDSEKRWQRAVTWYDWDKRGRPVEG